MASASLADLLGRLNQDLLDTMSTRFVTLEQTVRDAGGQTGTTSSMLLIARLRSRSTGSSSMCCWFARFRRTREAARCSRAARQPQRRRCVCVRAQSPRAFPSMVLMLVWRRSPECTRQGRDRRERLLAAVLLLALGAASPVWAEQDSQLAGSITDQTGAALAGVIVTLHGRDTRRVDTNAAGHFEFGDLPAGDYELDARRAGFKPAHSRVSLRSGEPSVMSLTLSVAIVEQTNDTGLSDARCDFETCGAKTIRRQSRRASLLHRQFRMRVHVLVKGFQLWEKIFEIEQRQIGRTCLIRCHGLLHHDRKCGSLRLIRSLRKLPR